ncbi:unnamed protein product [Effrenium voratum]|nr:unnamed protein product [Effrenium voratum]
MGTCCSEQQIVEDTPFLITRSNEEFVVDAFTLKVFARTMWPILTKFGEGVVKDELMPKVNAKLPSHLAISIRRFSLGDKPPEFGPLRIIETTNAIFTQIDDSDRIRALLPISWQSDEEIAVMVMGLPVGVCSIKVRGELLVDMGPIMDTAPFIAGVGFTLPDPPQIAFDLTGVANVGDLPPIKHAIYKLIETLIAEQLVLPNRIGIPTEYIGADPWVVKNPAPIGLLRINVVSASNLPSEDMTGQSDPFVEVKIGYSDKDFTSKVINDQTSPVWNEQTAFFPVYSLFQRLHVHIYDSDFWTPHDSIGQIQELRVHDVILLDGPKDFPLHRADGKQVPKATMKLGFEWLELKPALMTDRVPVAVDVYNLSVVIDKIIASSAHRRKGYYISGQIDAREEGAKEDTKVMEFTTAQATESAGHRDQFVYASVLTKMEEHKMSVEQQSAITGLTVEEIKAFQMGIPPNHLVPEYNVGIQKNVQMSRKQLETGTVTLSLLDEDKKVVSQNSVRIENNVTKADGLTVPLHLPGGTQIWYKLHMRSPVKDAASYANDVPNAADADAIAKNKSTTFGCCLKCFPSAGTTGPRLPTQNRGLR